MQKQPNFLKQLSLYSLLSVLVLSVLLVLPITDNFIAHTKSYLLFAAAILVGLLFIVRSLKRSSFDIVLSPLTTPLLAFGIVTAVSTFATNTYPVENLLGFGGVYLAVVTIGLLGSSLLPKHATDKFLVVLGGAGVALFATNLLQLIGFGPAQLLNQMLNIELPSSFVFNLAGSSLVAVQLMLVALVGLVVQSVTNKFISTATAVMAPILVIALAVYGWSLLPGNPGEIRLPSLGASWSVAIDTLRLPKSALIGVGPAAYTNTYNQFKPMWVNAQPFWNIQFSQAAIFPLTVLTTLGVFGLAAWGFLATRLVKMYKEVNKENRALVAVAISMIVLQILLPINVVLLTVFAITLAVLVATERHKLPVVQLHPLSVKVINQVRSDIEAMVAPKRSSLVSPFGALAALLLIGIITLTYFVGRTYAAHVLMNESSKAVVQEDVVSAYQAQQRAVQLNPYLDTFRRRFAATNMLIAIAISNKVDATEEDQQQVGQLLQDAIREARAATLLDPTDVENWLTLAQIYENMIGANEEATDWAVQSYVNAIETHPTDPTLRLALGGIFLGQEDYGQAASFFQQAVNLKPDFANAYYNLAVSLVQLNQLEQAKAAYQQVLVLLDPSSEDYLAVTSELEKLEEEIAARAEQEPAPEEEAAAATQPNILESNLENQADVVRQPAGNVDLEQNDSPATPESDAEAASEPSPAATGSSETDPAAQ